MTVLQQAFQDAGYKPTSERLFEVALEAAKAPPSTWDSAKDALFAAVRNDAALLWEMFEPYRAQAANRLLAGVMAEIKRSERATPGPSAPGQSPDDVQAGSARRADTHSSGGGGLDGGGYQKSAAPIPRSGMDAVAAVTRLSLLDTFKINGQPIGKVTSSEALRWAGSRERDARFVRLLTANLPPERPIGEFRTPEDTQAIYEQASKEARDAE